MNDTSDPYERLPYAGEAYAQTHPNRIGTIAALFGMRPAHVPCCRVLELGCGFGGNLIPMAEQWPSARFVGLDLSERAVAHGRAIVRAVGLRNIELRHGDILDVRPGAGEFDYIIAHGVYSWVPDPVRRKVWAICREGLAPHGVAFVSFNALPGGHRRRIMRELMQYHTRAISDPVEKVRQARAICAHLAGCAGGGLYGEVLREELERIEARDAPLYHDDLSPENRAFLLQDVVEAAEAAGLQYLGEATLAHSNVGILPPFAAGTLAQIPEEAFALREQYLDFLFGRNFHQSLWCRSEIALNRSIETATVARLHVAENEASNVPGGHGGPKARDRRRTDGRSRAPESATDTDRLLEAALAQVCACAPQAVPFASVLRGVLERLRQSNVKLAAPERAEPSLAAALLGAYRANRIELWLDAPAIAPCVTERPRASRIARYQAWAKTRVTNLRHANVNLDEAQRQCLLLADGSRDVHDIAASLAAAGKDRGAKALLEELARLALLAA
ncbi:MAG TPA: methyltransferase domain-containing protein [Xanthobacteraceae bacterium]|nr:methyltransferase domain-containing protein [Xanthobacteraceae bacterium]